VAPNLVANTDVTVANRDGLHPFTEVTWEWLHGREEAQAADGGGEARARPQPAANHIRQGGLTAGAPASSHQVETSRRSPANLSSAPSPEVGEWARGTCAICTYVGACKLQMLDRRAVLVCVRCEEEHPRAGGYDAGNVGRPTVHGVTRGGPMGLGHRRKGVHD